MSGRVLTDLNNEVESIPWIPKHEQAQLWFSYTSPVVQNGPWPIHFSRLCIDSNPSQCMELLLSFSERFPNPVEAPTTSSNRTLLGGLLALLLGTMELLFFLYFLARPPPPKSKDATSKTGPTRILPTCWRLFTEPSKAASGASISLPLLLAFGMELAI